MLIRIDQTSPVPMYAQVASSVRRQVASGELAVGTRLPPARELADALGVNLHTVLRGYQELRDEGVIELRRGRGAVVRRAHDTARVRAALADFVEQARRAGLSADEAQALVREGMES